MLRPDKTRQRQSACGEGNRLAEIVPSHTLTACRTVLHSIAFTRTPHVGRAQVAASVALFRSGTAGRRQNDLQDEDLPQAPRTSVVANSDDPPLTARRCCSRATVRVMLRSACERRTLTAPVGHRAPRSNSVDDDRGRARTQTSTSRRRRTYRMPRVQHDEPRPRTSTSRGLLRGRAAVDLRSD